MEGKGVPKKGRPCQEPGKGKTFPIKIYKVLEAPAEDEPLEKPTNVKESFDMVHDCLNPTLADWRMASSDNMDEVQVWKRHDKQRAAIESLMESNLEKETNHGEVTQSLQDLSRGLTAVEMDKDIQEASDLSEEFLGKKHHKIQKFMLDIEASIRRLHELCGFKNRRIDQQEAENLLLKEENAAHQLQIRKLRDTMSGKQGSAEESLEQVMKSPMLQSLTLTEVTPALFKSEDCKLHLFPPVPRPSNSHPFLIIEPCKLARSPTAAVNRCHRLPPKAQAIPLVPARAETKLPALMIKGSGERWLNKLGLQFEPTISNTAECYSEETDHEEAESTESPLPVHRADDFCEYIWSTRQWTSGHPLTPPSNPANQTVPSLHLSA
ncbi:hypothetical protein DPEC_G00238110 [Dallia pectoralis]|uniref:Uncharacterized protein n=1 Tax=Dallia pectoralis TaxID=75939 RepID=A0ACC2FZ13_DALPE|nr:hypothetical protein DPEC_G00238110 [Dallia pectoralis]